MITERLYYHDCYLRRFAGLVVDRSADSKTIYLDRTAFYPSSGGQPNDLGMLGDSPVLDVLDEDDRIAHVLASPLTAAEATGMIDWPRRFDHMQQHSGQHLLSAMFADQCGARTVSFHLGQDASTIDLDGLNLAPELIAAVEARANEAVFANLPITVSLESAASVSDLRKPSEREGTLRVISIDALDRSACGGTHVRSTGEIGLILIRKLEKIRNSVRVEFLCGRRALRRARMDYLALARVARMFSATLEEAPAQVAALLESSKTAEKQRRKLESELARYHGRELYDSTAADAAGFRVVTRRIPQGDFEELRGLAQSFTAQPKAVFTAILEQPPSLLLAVSEDSGADAGAIVKSAVTTLGGRGGGTARLAQGSVPDRGKLDALVDAVNAALAR
jgi:alanyl-tRNA synthetase